MDVKSETYQVSYDPATAIVTFQGSVRLLGTKDYDLVKQLLDDVVTSAPKTLTLDLHALRFLNSLGTYLLLGFMLKLRDNANGRVLVRGKEGASWQKRIFRDLKRLAMDSSLKVAFEAVSS